MKTKKSYLYYIGGQEVILTPECNNGRLEHQPVNHMNGFYCRNCGAWLKKDSSGKWVSKE